MATYNFIRVSNLKALTAKLHETYNDNQDYIDFVLRYEYGYVNGHIVNVPREEIAFHNNAYQGGSSISVKIHEAVTLAVGFPELTREPILALMLANIH